MNMQRIVAQVLNDEWRTNEETSDDHQMTNDARFNTTHISSMFNKASTMRFIDLRIKTQESTLHT
jgi:hypothetical protein